MAADVVHGDARHDLGLAVVKRAAARKDLAHHGDDVLDFERQPQRPMAHAAAGGIGHFAVLQMIAGLGKQIVVAAMVVMQVADDDVLDAVGRDAKRREPLAYRLDHLALALLAHRLVEAGIDHDGAGRSDDRPNEEVERLQHVVRIAIDVIGRCRAGVAAVADRIDFVRVVAHGFPSVSSPAAILSRGFRQIKAVAATARHPAAESSKEQRIFCGRLTQHLNPTFAVHRPQWREGVEGPALMGPNPMFGNLRRLSARRDSTATVSEPAAGAVAQTIPLRRLWWAAILLLGLSASAVVWTIGQLRADAISAAVSETGNIASVLAVQLSRSLKSIDTVLIEIKQSAERHDIDSAADFQAAIGRREFQESLTNYLGRLPQVFSIAVADREGQIVVSTTGWAATRFNVAGRDFFWKARDRRDGQLITSIPAVNRVNDKQTIVFARRLEDSKGNFVGVVLAGVNTKYFEDIYGATQSVHSLLFTLLDPDGIILFRHPDGADAAGKALSNR